jgi:hypothetical protein
MRVYLHYETSKRKPRVGDTKLIKGKLHVRVLRPAYQNGKRIGHQVSGGRPLYDWQLVEDQSKS